MVSYDCRVTFRKRQDSERDYNPVDFSKSAEAQPLEESFTIHLGNVIWIIGREMVLLQGHGLTEK